ncbi:unnamed protein product [Medioppia subpectinata]|uniref:Peptidase M14 domain-containing protein n=1 Tax=Medioppia subpectinata TaxID=1979941 RepID=A0A7R9Q9M8_9ACAR|nr:unnamed protein product [Medioppia subpectinata]CAG2116740.1 unnamed protein product [Medioppia subpectinata]
MGDMRPVTTLIGPDGGNQFLRALNASRIRYEVVVNNFQTVIDEEKAENLRNIMYSTRAFDYDTVYHTYDEIRDEMRRVDDEGKDIPGLIITNPNGAAKKAIFLECGIHAREWISTAACLWISNQLVTTTTYDSLLDKYEFIIVPTLNVDGYIYTHTTNRNWRKTRSQNGLCYGADPNRNWDAAFCETGASSSPCSDTYCGKSVFSESEAKAMADLVKTKAATTAAYVSVHSYSQLWMYPWGYKSANPPNKARLDELSAAGTAAIKATDGRTFKYGTIANTIYVASGSSIDYVYDKLGVEIAFALELRPDANASNGFILPASQIKIASQEFWNGLRAMIEKL